MKNKMLILSIVVIAATAISCNSGSDNVSSSTTITCSTHSISFEKTASTAIITIGSTKEWTIYSDQNWITCSPSSSIKTSETVIVSIAKNSDVSARSGILVIKSGTARDTIKVSQVGDVVTDITAPDGYKLVWHDEFDDARSIGGKPAM